MGILSLAIDKFNNAVARLEEGIEPFAKQADGAAPFMEELSSLKKHHKLLVSEVESLRKQAKKDLNLRENAGEKLDKTIGELKRILG